MGPFYWLTSKVGLPMWVAQRLWLGSLLFFAGAGVWFLLRTLRWSTLPATVAAFAYALTPYTLTLEARLSAILLPFTGLPWMIAFTIRAIRRGGWREPAFFALVILAVGGTNATGLIYAGVGPLLWFPFAIWVTKEAPWRRAAGAFGRIGVLTLLTSLWWIAGLSLQGGYGIDVLKYTETAKVVASAAVAPEVLRGLGYWFFYGGDRLGPWIEPGVAYTQRLWLIVVSYLTPVLALLGGAMSRWKHRAYFVTLAAVGLFIAVGAHPWDDPPLTGRWWQALLESDRGLAMRSTPRAIPLVVLGLAVLLSAGIAVVIRSAPRAAVPAGVAVLALIVAGLPPLYTGDMVAANLKRPEDLPQYWLDAAAALDAQPHDTRVFEVPGTDFASYRWGNTVDPITPGLMDRPYVARAHPLRLAAVGRSAQRLRSTSPGEHPRSGGDRPDRAAPRRRTDRRSQRPPVRAVSRGSPVRGDAAPAFCAGAAAGQHVRRTDDQPAHPDRPDERRSCPARRHGNAVRAGRGVHGRGPAGDHSGRRRAAAGPRLG